MPFALNAASSRLRSSPAAAHWSGARTVPRILRVTPYSPRASTRSTRGASMTRRFQAGSDGHLATDVVDDLDRLVDVRAVGDGDVLVDPRPDPGQVAGDGDLAVGDRVDDAVEVAQRRPPQAEVLDRAGHAGDPDDVALAELVLDEDERAVEVVADEVLGAEPDGDPDDAEAGDRRTDVEAELAEDHQPGDDRR